MPDMLVKLYELPGSSELLKDLAKEKIRIHRALAPDKERVLNWWVNTPRQGKKRSGRVL